MRSNVSPEPNLAAAFANHNRLFKELLTVFFMDFLLLFAPELAAKIDTGSIEFLTQEVFGDLTTGTKRIVDLLVKVQLPGQSAEDVFILIHVENQSKVEANFARRMFQITARLDEKYALPIYPIALFSFDSPMRKEPNRYKIKTVGRTFLEFQFDAIQLNRLNWRDFANLRNPIAGALLAKMKIAPEDRPGVKLQCARIIATSRLDPARDRLLSGFLDAHLRLNPAETRIFNAAVAALPPDERELTMPLTISWKEEGRVEGRVEEAKEFLLLLGEKRFGPPTPDTARRIGNISQIKRLRKMAVRLLEVDKWDDLLAS